MNSLVIPPSPNWYEPSILACAQDNTLIYGARNDIVIIYDSQKDQPADVKIIPKAHSHKITSVSLNKNWGQPNKFLVTTAEDKVVKLWNLETLEKKLSHSLHKNHNKIVGATFAGDERIISVSEDGVIVVWNLGTNQPNLLEIFGFKVTVTCISTCPHANWLTAFGLKNGLVIVADLRKQGKILYKLRGHDKSVLSLSWCPVPINVFPKVPHNYVGQQRPEEETNVKQTTDSIKDTDNVKDETNNEKIAVASSECTLPKNHSKYKNKNNIWTNLKHADDDERPEDSKAKERTHPLLKVYDSDDDDFLKECQILRDQIMSSDKSNASSDDVKTEERKGRRILKPKKQPKSKNVVENSQKEEEEENALLYTAATGEDSKIEEDTERCEEKAETPTEKQPEGKNIVGDSQKQEEEEEEENVLLYVAATGDDGDIEEDSENCREQAETLGNEEQDKSVGEYVEETNTIERELPEDEAKINKEQIEGNMAKVENQTEASAGCTTELKIQEGEKDVSDVSKQNETRVSEDGLNTLGEKVDLIDGGKVSVSDDTRKIPVNVPVVEEPRKEFLLASSAKEGYIYIWRAGTDGRLQTFLTVPNKYNNRNHSRSNVDKMWIVLCWVSPNVLLSSSRSGELLDWRLPKPKDKSKHVRLIHNDHSSLLFSIAAPTAILDSFTWMDVDDREMNAWTVGQDRLLLNTSLSSKSTNLCCYPTVGMVECFAPSPLDPSRLAIGTGEGIIKIWDLSRPHTKQIPMTNFYQKIQSKVLTLAWHPTNEVQLAYGTLEGRIGYLDITNRSKSPTLLPNFFKSQIHKIEWGPLNGNKEELGLFAVAEGKLIAFNIRKSNQDPLEVDTPDNTFVYTFSWKPDYQTMLVSSKSGSLMVYSPDLKILSTHYLQRKLQTICWHPDASQNDRTVSKYCHWFASISNSKEVLIYDFGIETEDNEQKIVAKFKAGDTINCLAWSSFDEKQLVVAGDDGIAQVWDVEANVVLSTYINPNFENIFAVTWSPIDPDFVISAGRDHTIRIWKISANPVKTEQEISDMRKNCIKENSDNPTEEAPKPEKEEPSKIKKINKNVLLPNFYNPKNTAQIIADLRKLLAWKEDSNCGIESQIGDSEPSILNVFGSNADMLKIIQSNEASHKTRGKHHLQNTLSLFKGDVSTTVKEAIEEKRVTPWIIMMAPMVSPKLWKAACEVYARQLSEESGSDPLEIATYYLACHKIEEAVNVLCEGALFREALALAKSRLPENDPLVTKVIENWASYSLIVGNFETAAQCNIFLGKYEEAASVLFRRSDVETLEFAAELAKKSGNEELHKAVLFRHNAFKKENDGAKVDGALPSKIEVMLEKERLEKNDEKKECIEMVEIQGKNGEAKGLALDNEELKVEEAIEAMERDLSSLNGNSVTVGHETHGDGEKFVENGANGLSNAEAV